MVGPFSTIQRESMPKKRTYVCKKCKRFKFSKPVVCFWCRQPEKVIDLFA